MPAERRTDRKRDAQADRETNRQKERHMTGSEKSRCTLYTDKQRCTISPLHHTFFHFCTHDMLADNKTGILRSRLELKTRTIFADFSSDKFRLIRHLFKYCFYDDLYSYLYV